MFEKCIKCEHLGKDCVPNLCILPLEEVNKWAIKLKAYKRMTNAELSLRSGVPKGTIDMHFSKKKDHYPDVSYSTFAPIFCALIGNNELHCQKEKLDGNSEGIEHVIEESQKKIDFLKDETFLLRKAVVILGAVLGITLVMIVIALIIDRTNPDIGFIRK